MSEAEKSQSSEIGLADTARRFAELSESPQAQADTGKQRKVDAEVGETEAAAEYADETTSEDEWTPEDSGSDDDVEFLQSMFESEDKNMVKIAQAALDKLNSLPTN